MIKFEFVGDTYTQRDVGIVIRDFIKWLKGENNEKILYNFWIRTLKRF